MLDLVALICIAVAFGLGIAYTRGCDRLMKGDRS